MYILNAMYVSLGIAFNCSIFSTYDRGWAQYFLALLTLVLFMTCFGHRNMERSDSILVVSQSHKRYYVFLQNYFLVL